MAKKTGRPFSYVPSLELPFHFGKDKAPMFLMFLQPHIAETLLCMGEDERTEAPFPHPGPICMVGVLL